MYLSESYLATVVLAYRNLTSQYTIPRKIALAIIISEMANIFIFNTNLFWYQFTQNAIGTNYILDFKKSYLIK